MPEPPVANKIITIACCRCVCGRVSSVLCIQVAFRVLVYPFAFIARKTPFDHIPRPHSYRYADPAAEFIRCSLPASASIRLTRHRFSLGTPPDKHVRSGLPYGQSGPKISRKSSDPRAFYVEPRVPVWSTDLADVAAVGGSWGQQFLECHSAGPL
jgi:hypothetical protein